MSPISERLTRALADRGRLIGRLARVVGADREERRRDLLLRTGRLHPPRGKLPADFRDRARPADPQGLGLAALLAERDSSAPDPDRT